MLNKTRQDCEYFYTTFNREDSNQNISKALLTMNITDSKYYIYSLKGLLRERVSFHHLTAQYGMVRAVSNNGQIFVFKKSSSFELNILLMTNKNGLFFVKTINIQSQIIKYLENDEAPVVENLREAVGPKGDYFCIKNQPSDCWIEYVLNDSMDLIVRIQSSNEPKR